MSPAQVQSLDSTNPDKKPHHDPESMHYAEASDPENEANFTTEERILSNENEIQLQLSRQHSAKDIGDLVRKHHRRKVCFFAVVSVFVGAAVAAGITIGVKEKRQNDNKSSAANSNNSGASSQPTPTLYDMCLISAESTYTSQNNITCSKNPDENKYDDGIFSYGTTDADNENKSRGRWAKLADAIHGEAGGDNSGLAIDMSCDGSIVAIGALMNDAGDAERTPNIGHVRVFELQENSKRKELMWKQLGEDIDGAAAQDRFGGSLSLSADGKRIAIGAIGHDASDETTSIGLVQVYDYRMGDWIKLTDDLRGTEESQFFGRSVSLSADGMRLAVGSSGADSDAVDGDDVGMVEVFELDKNNAWQAIGQKIYGQHGKSTYFGRSVSLSGGGSTLAVGGFGGNYGNNEDAGVVQVFRWKEELGTWAQQGRDLHGKKGIIGDWFGLSVGLNYGGTRVAVGAPGDNSMQNLVPGYTMVFEQTSTNEWEQLGQDLDGGYSVSISFDGNRVAAGSYKHFDNGINSGGVRIYKYLGRKGGKPTWITSGQHLNGEARSMFGSSVAMSSNGKRIISGAPASVGKDGRLHVGSTQVYEWCGI